MIVSRRDCPDRCVASHRNASIKGNQGMTRQTREQQIRLDLCAARRGAADKLYICAATLDGATNSLGYWISSTWGLFASALLRYLNGTERNNSSTT